MLGQPLDREKGLIVSRAVPVGLQLVRVEERPFRHEAQRAWRGSQPAITSPSKSTDALYSA
jgi:hypothetical protein